MTTIKPTALLLSPSRTTVVDRARLTTRHRGAPGLRLSSRLGETVAKFIAGLLLLGTALSVGAQPASLPVSRVQAASRVLLVHYNKVRGLFDTAGWWNSANGITALADAVQLPGGHANMGLFENTFARAQRRFPGFLNEFYDDEGWWALAWIAVYDVDHQPERLVMAKKIFGDMTAGWDDVCGGGIWWKKDKHYKNAIANELFLSIAAKLAQRTSGRERLDYRAWAEREWSWFDQSGMINPHLIVNDGLDPACHNNGKYGSSYNQGVILSGLVDLGEVAGKAEMRATAQRLAAASMVRLSGRDGVVRDGCEPGCGGDAVQFKGIYVRNLRYLLNATSDPAVSRLLVLNRDALWGQQRNEAGDFSASWSGPPGFNGAPADIAALDLFVAASGTASHGGEQDDCHRMKSVASIMCRRRANSSFGEN